MSGTETEGTPVTRHRMITADTFHNALLAAGVVQPGESIRRIVIDAQVGHAVVMYLERFADERLLSVVTTLDGIEVRTTGGGQ